MQVEEGKEREGGNEDHRHAGHTHLTTGQAGQQAQSTCTVWEATKSERIQQTSARRGPVGSGSQRAHGRQSFEREERTHSDSRGQDPRGGRTRARVDSQQEKPHLSTIRATETQLPKCPGRGSRPEGTLRPMGTRPRKGPWRSPEHSSWPGTTGHIRLVRGRGQGISPSCGHRGLLGQNISISKATEPLAITLGVKSKEENSVLLKIFHRQVQ